MKLSAVQLIAIVATIAVAVDYASAYGFLDGLSLLQSYYGSMMPALPAAAPPPPPPPPVLPPAPVMPPCAPEPPKTACACDCHHPSCLSLIKPCLHAKLLNLKKKLIEKKLAHLIACCAQYNSHLCQQSC